PNIEKKLTEALILIAPNWDLPFELMCDASDFAIGAVLGQRHEKYFKPIHYASKTMNDADYNYTTTEKEMLAVVMPRRDCSGGFYCSKNLISRFGTPRATISDRGTYFCNDQFAKLMLKYGVTHRLSTAYHLQTSGQVEVSNRGLKRILERTIVIYKEKTKRIHDSKIKNRVFNVGDRVLLFNSRLKIFLGKLKTRLSGPFTITKDFPYGTVELSQANGPNFKVNGHRVKHYFGGDVPQLDYPNAPGTFQRCMLAIFHDMVEKTMEVFMDDFSVFGNSFENCLSRLDKMLQMCEDTNLCLNWEKSHFMVKEGIVLGHKISKNMIEVEAKALPTNDARVVCKFPKSLFARFGASRAIISDRGTYFCKDRFAKVMLKYGVTHRLSIAYHPQTSGQVEDCPDCEVSRALSFCPSFTRASHPQLHFGNPVS
nr:reverse transcriptase domain-containing protein [Tanacetum cinerariifolium]